MEGSIWILSEDALIDERLELDLAATIFGISTRGGT